MPSDVAPEIQLFTDGGCSGNPGPGGWAYILRHIPSGKEKEVAGSEQETTNNRMELTAVIRGLESLQRKCVVEVITDSTYVGKGMTQWLTKWKSNGWKRKEGQEWKPIKNLEMWQLLAAQLERHEVLYRRVAGHSGHPENDRCDEMAVAAYQQYLD
ncbi:MAG: ribonuclease HI [Pirellulaceae bacterium]|jgi:ribonuclease HI